MRIFLLFVGLTGIIEAQSTDFEGYVMDDGSKKPIPYVNLSFLNTLVGTSTDEKGHFLLEISETFLKKNVHISSLGYKDTILRAALIKKTGRVFLREDRMELQEVAVRGNLDNVQIMNPVYSHDILSGFNSSSTPWVIALYFPNIGGSKKYVEKIQVHFRENGKFGKMQSRFRLRIYDVDPQTKFPTRDLLQESLVVETPKEKDFISIDLSEHKIIMPDRGIYVGLEWLFIPFNWYMKKEEDRWTGKSVIEDRFAPTFGGVYSKDPNSKVMVYGMGQWQNFMVMDKKNKEILIPAITMRVAQELK